MKQIERIATLHVKVVPNSSANRLMGWIGPLLKVRVAAPPERGRANAAVIDLLTTTLRLPRGSIRVSTGHTSAHKTMTVTGLTDQELRARVERAVAMNSSR